MVSSKLLGLPLVTPTSYYPFDEFSDGLKGLLAGETIKGLPAGRRRAEGCGNQGGGSGFQVLWSDPDPI